MPILQGKASKNLLASLISNLKNPLLFSRRGRYAIKAKRGWLAPGLPSILKTNYNCQDFL